MATKKKANVRKIEPKITAKPAAEGALTPPVQSVAYRGAVPLKGFVGWVAVVIIAAFLVGFGAAQLLVSQRMGQLVDETAARVELQAQGRSAVIAEWVRGIEKIGDILANAEVVKLFVAESVKAPMGPDGGLAQAMMAQRPYMEMALKEFATKNKLNGAHVVLADGTALVGYGEVSQAMGKDKEAIRAVVQGGKGTILPLHMTQNGVVMDVLRPVRQPSTDEQGAVIAVLWYSMPVGDKLAELVAATALDRRGERTALLENVNGQAMVVGRTNLGEIAENYMDLEHRLAGGKVVEESVIDGTAVFATLKPIDGTPFALLQEYNAHEALGMMALYKPGLYVIIALVVVVLAALMLAMTLHLMGQRNKTRVKLLGQTMEALVRVVEARDPYLAGHHGRVARLSVQVGNALGMNTGERATLYYAANLASVGRLLVPRNVLSKKAKLTGNERRDLEGHISHAVAILGDLDFDLPIVPVIAQIYERVDGSGHPYGLKDNEINRMSKVLGACDAYVAMTSERAHRRAMTKESAIKAMSEGAFAKDVVNVLKRVG